MNTSTTSVYNTGTIASNSGGALIGSGTTWAANMVGGNAANIGAIALDKDTYTGTPYNGTGQQLLNWYQITVVSNPTTIGIFSNSTAGDLGYRGVGAFPSTYTIRPAARILYIDFVSGKCICETSTHIWTNGDLVECVMCPYPDCSGDNVQVQTFSSGGTYRTAFQIQNSGARTFATGLNLTGFYNATNTGNSDTWGWATGLNINYAQTAIAITGACKDVMDINLIPSGHVISGSGNTLDMSVTPFLGWTFNGFLAIQSGSGSTPYGMVLSSTGSMAPTGQASCFDIYLNAAAHKGIRVIASPHVVTVDLAEFAGADGHTSGFTSNATLFCPLQKFTPIDYANLGQFTDPIVEGMVVAFSAANTNTPGASITATGAFHVLGYFNGTNWVVL